MPNGVIFNENSGPVTVVNEDRISRTSILGTLIEIIATGNCESINLDRIPAEIENKVNFNNLSTYQWVIEEYIGSSLLIDESIRELNQTILNGSTKLKRQMKIFYFKSLSKYSISTKPFDINRLKANSDNVVQEVINLATKFVKDSADVKSGYFDEDIDYGIALITSYSIIECIVLENPYDHD